MQSLPPLAKVIGRVILARQAGQSIPAVPGRFGQWLRRRGLSKATVRSVKSRLNRARRLLGGRTFKSAMPEIAALEEIQEFADLSTRTRSDLRSALKLYREWQTEAVQKRQQLSSMAPAPMKMAA